MSALTSPQGPLPARVYWFRRVMVLAVVFLVVFGTARLFGGDDEGSAERAAQASASAKKSGTEKNGTAKAGGPEDSDAKDVKDGTGVAPTAGATPSAGATPTAAATPTATPTETETPLPAPTGACRNSDVVVTPQVAKERRTVRVGIDLVLRTKTAVACTWEVSPKNLTVKIDSGPRNNPDDIWLSAHCPAAVPTKSVTVYRDTDTSVRMVWSGRRSDPECSRTTNWAKVGWYHVKAAAYAGEPTDVQFELRRPSPVTVTKTVDPKPEKKKLTAAQKRAILKARAAKKEREQEQASTPKPSGAVEPNG